MRSATLIGPTTRLRLLRLVMLSGFVVLAARAAQLSVPDSRAHELALRQIRTVLDLPAPRGLIVDRRGVELAVTLLAPSLYVMPRDLVNPAAAAAQLAPLLGRDPKALAERLANRSRFTFLKRWASAQEADAVMGLGLRGVGVLKEPRRAYPAGALAGQLIGFANIDGQGVRAIEQQEDATLRGHERRVRVERDARGRLLIAEADVPRDTAGGDVRLTIDAALQAEAEAALARAIEKTGARGGVVVTMDPDTGDLLSIAEAPAVDPNQFRTLDYQSTRSRAFLDAIEPGSTLKAFLVAGALDAGVIHKDETIDTGPGWIRIPGKVIRDHHPYGAISVADVLQVSSNVGAVIIGQRLEPERHYNVLRGFGFGSPSGSGFPQESAGILRHFDRWQPLDHATVSFGQGIGVTPVQLAAATAALANGGVWRKPRLIDARREPHGPWVSTPVDEGRRVVKSEAAIATLEMMERVVSATGTGRRAALRDLRVAGKTGTAQKFDREAGRYSQTAYLAWFIGAVPADDPRLAIVVVLDEPSGRAHGGGDVAAPLFAEVAATQLARLAILTDPQPIRAKRFPTLADRLALIETQIEPLIKPLIKPETKGPAATPIPHDAPSPAMSPALSRATSQSARKPLPKARPDTVVTALFIPDFRGETLDSALRMAARDSLVLEPEGDRRGLAVEQHPVPGTVVTGERPRVRLRFTLAEEG